MPAYADTIRDALDRRDRRRASVCPRHGPIRNGRSRGRCGRSRACTLAQRAAQAARIEETSPQIVPVPSALLGDQVTATHLHDALSVAAARIRDAIAGLGTGAPRGMASPYVQRHRVDIHERCTMISQVSVEILVHHGTGIIRELLHRMATRIGYAVLERHVPDIPRTQASLAQRPNITLRNMEVRFDREFDEIHYWDGRMPTTTPTHLTITGETEDGREIEIETDGEVRFDQDMMRNAWGVTLTTGASTTLSWTYPMQVTYTATTTTGQYWNGGTAATIYYDNTRYPRAELNEYQSGPYPQHMYRRQHVELPEPPERTPEEIEAERVAREERLAQRRIIEAERAERHRELLERERAEEAVRRAEMRAAEQRATALLRSLLTPDQLAEMDDRETITVRGSEGTLFRLTVTHYDGNVRWLDEHGVERGRMCAHPVAWDGEGTLPRPDIIAGQVLALRTDERAFVRIANRFDGAMPTYPEREEVAA